jgi:hypothetical protein
MGRHQNVARVAKKKNVARDVLVYARDGEPRTKINRKYAQ